jgi:hypothetical protein
LRWGGKRCPVFFLKFLVELLKRRGFAKNTWPCAYRANILLLVANFGWFLQAKHQTTFNALLPKNMPDAKF